MAAGDTTTELHHRWTPVNRHKNAPVTIVLNRGWNGERFAVPPQHVPTDSEEALIGSTTLHDLIKRVKSQIPTLYLMLEEGGAVLSCGLNEVHSSEWKTTMLCQLIYGKDDSGATTSIKLNDGRNAIEISVGTVCSMQTKGQTVVQRCFAKGDIYG